MKRFATFAAVAASSLLVVAAPATPAPPPAADRDGDKIFDDLERSLAPKGPADAVDVIVVLRAPATAERVGALEREVDGFATKRRFTIVDAFAARMTKGTVAALARRGDVLHVEADARIHSLNDTAQASFGVTKARIDAGVDGDADGKPSYSKDDLVAAVVDTGIDTAHRDLDGAKVLAFVSCLSGSTCTNAPPVDPNGHGTHVAATIAGDGEGRADRLYRGVAPGAALVGVRVLDEKGEGHMSNALVALQWLVNNRTTYGIDVVNLSLGGDGCSSGGDAVSAAVNKAHAEGLLVVVSAGNEGPAACTIASPAAAANAVTVGAMADVAKNGFRLAAFSSRGPTADGRAKPDVVAPGVRIMSAWAGTTAGYVAYDGTSMAAPFVAGVALLMLDANRALSPSEVKARLVATAVDWNAAGSDFESGAGRLDAYAAIRAAGAAIAAPPDVPTHAAAQGSLPGRGATLAYPISVVRAGFPLAATLVSPGWTSSGQTPDLDLVLLNASGIVVATGATPARSDWPALRRHEEVALPVAAPGSYTLRVVSAAGAGPFVLDVSGGLAPGAVLGPAAATSPLPPSVSVPPATAGFAQEGQTLSATTGAWWGTDPISYSYQWRRCDALGNACGDVTGATASTYALAAPDVGATLRVAVTATDLGGSASAVSAATGVVARAPDRTRPVARALASAGKRGTSVRLLYRASDDRGRTRERVQVYRGTRLLKTISTRLQARQPGRTYGVAWRAPRKSERLRFCVRAWDAEGNAGTRTCAAVRIR